MSNLLSPYFDHNLSPAELNLGEDLVEEFISMSGVMMVYVPRTSAVIDEVLNEVTRSEFNNAYQVPFAMTSIPTTLNSFELDRIGLDYTIGNLYELAVSKRVFKSILGSTEAAPAEGDLIYDPTAKIFLQIVDAGPREEVYISAGQFWYFTISAKPYKQTHDVWSDNSLDDMAAFIDPDDVNDLRAYNDASNMLDRRAPAADNTCNFTVDDGITLTDNDWRGIPVRPFTADSDCITADDISSLDASNSVIDKPNLTGYLDQLDDLEPFSRNKVYVDQAVDTVEELNIDKTFGFE